MLGNAVFGLILSAASVIAAVPSIPPSLQSRDFKVLIGYRSATQKEAEKMLDKKKLAYDIAKDHLPSTQLGIGVYLTQEPEDVPEELACSVKVDASAWVKTPKVWIPQWYGSISQKIWGDRDMIADYVALKKVNNKQDWKAKSSILMAFDQRYGTSKRFLMVPEELADKDDMGWEIECNWFANQLHEQGKVNYDQWTKMVGGSRYPVEEDNEEWDGETKSKLGKLIDKITRDTE
ncbi:hypothetical protein F5X96DRAFT_695181 [Biscogniauxia mediterranea]|nr:hypothetical protein F5X96DRAFT_695181 [Biscogniauxia mediterranea]